MSSFDNGRRVGFARALFGSASVLAMGCLSAPAIAQDAPAAADSGQAEGGIADIVVTAQRRAQNIQDVPIAITAISGAALEQRNITNVQQLNGLAPNVTIVSRRNASSIIAMRGAVTFNPSIIYDPTVGLYIDGVYIGKSQGSVFDIADIENLEVLRGPQGTLFGRNTLAGAINIVTEKPSGELRGKFKLGYGNYNEKIARFSLDLPAAGALSAKISGFYFDRDGFVDIRSNPFPNVVNALTPVVNELESRQNYAFRTALRLEASEALTFDLAADYSHLNNRSTLNQLVAFGKGGIFDPTSANYRGALVNFGPANLYVQPNRRFSYGYATGGISNSPIYERSKTWSASLTGTLDLGDATLKSITAYREMNFEQAMDLDGTPLPLISSNLSNKYNSFSQELQVSGKTGGLVYTGGLYYFRDAAPTNNDQAYFGNSLLPCANCVQALSFARLYYDFTNTAYAAYAQLEWTPPILDEKLTLTAGLRYTSERRSSNTSRTNFGSGVQLATSYFNARAAETFKGTTPTFVARYEVNDDFNFYVRYAEGFKSGGFNGEGANAAAATLAFRPETIESLEVGFKADLFDRRLRINAAAFSDLHKDMQLAVFVPSANLASIIANVGEARIKGFELEVQAIPIDGLNISANLGTLDAKYLKYLDSGVNVAKDRAFPFTPKMTASVSVDARLAQTDFGDLHVLVDYKHSDSYYLFPYSLTPTAAQNVYSTEADSVDNVDLRVSLQKIPIGGGQMEATAYVRNLFDESNRVVGTDYGASFGGLVVAGYNDPRTYGLTLSYKF
jgi:iron complex outermembrane receptor protein